MRRIAIPLFIIVILLCTIILPSTGQCCNYYEGTLMDYVKGLFSPSAYNPEDYPKSICWYVGGWDYYALGFTISAHETIPDRYWIELYILTRLRWWPPYPYYETFSVRECFLKSLRIAATSLLFLGFSRVGPRIKWAVVSSNEGS